MLERFYWGVSKELKVKASYQVPDDSSPYFFMRAYIVGRLTPRNLAVLLILCEVISRIPVRFCFSMWAFTSLNGLILLISVTSKERSAGVITSDCETTIALLILLISSRTFPGQEYIIILSIASLENCLKTFS